MRAHFEPSGAVNIVQWHVALGWSPPEEWTRLNVEAAEKLLGALRINVDRRAADRVRAQMAAADAALKGSTS